MDESNAELEDYIQHIKKVLIANEITTKEQRDVLKSECEKALSVYRENHKSVNAKVFDMLIGVPLGAFISALIYKSESNDILLAQLIGVIILGIAMIGAINILKKIMYYSVGVFKDQYLLNVLNELEYYPD